MAEQRKKIWIDHFQTRMLWRIVAYFIIYQAVVWFLIALQWHTQEGAAAVLGPNGSTFVAVSGAVAVVFLGLLFIVDAVKTMHRWVGPLVRVRKTIQAITAGEELTLVKFRQGDYLQELKDDINDMLKALEQRGAIVIKQTEAKDNVPVGV